MKASVRQQQEAPGEAAEGLLADIGCAKLLNHLSFFVTLLLTHQWVPGEMF